MMGDGRMMGAPGRMQGGVSQPLMQQQRQPPQQQQQQKQQPSKPGQPGKKVA